MDAAVESERQSSEGRVGRTWLMFERTVIGGAVKARGHDHGVDVSDACRLLDPLLDRLNDW